LLGRLPCAWRRGYSDGSRAADIDLTAASVAHSEQALRAAEAVFNLCQPKELPPVSPLPSSRAENDGTLKKFLLSQRQSKVALFFPRKWALPSLFPHCTIYVSLHENDPAFVYLCG
jgi:hypothetical protein